MNLEEFKVKLYRFCVACGKGTMENTDKPMPGYQDVYYCKCGSCGYIDCSALYVNLNPLTKDNIYNPKTKPNANELQTPK